MKPHRIAMAHELIHSYGLLKKMELYRPWKATEEDLMAWHSSVYINFLKSLGPEDVVKTEKIFNWRYMLYNVGYGDDCPVFPGLYEFSKISAGGSIAGAVTMNREDAHIAINWAGGLHHAKRNGAAGFCYVNDIVIGILELLKCHQRVLYIDIDVHHGDGVEEAFLTTDRVMTVSFHMYDGEFFPRTGDITDVGHGEGKYYSLNVPLKAGIGDKDYNDLFQSIMSKVMEHYQPNAIVLQCGADSLDGDRLGCFNLTLRGHADCVDFMKKYNLPMLLLGGGGYTVKNVARCWTYETAVALGVEIPNELPENAYSSYFDQDLQLHFTPVTSKQRKSCNKPKDLEKIKETLFEYLRELPCVPSAQLEEISGDGVPVGKPGYGGNADPDEGTSFSLARDKGINWDNDLSDSEDEEEAGRQDPHEKRPRLWIQKKKELAPAGGAAAASHDDNLPGPSGSGPVPSTSTTMAPVFNDVFDLSCVFDTVIPESMSNDRSLTSDPLDSFVTTSVTSEFVNTSRLFDEADVNMAMASNDNKDNV